MSSDPWLKGNLQERIGYNSELLTSATQTVEAVIQQATFQLKRPYQGQYPLDGLGIAILAKVDYEAGRAPDQGYLVILDVESDSGDFMIQFTVNGMTLPWIRVGRKTALMKPIAVGLGRQLVFKTSPPNIEVELWGFVIGTGVYLRTRNIKETVSL